MIFWYQKFDILISEIWIIHIRKSCVFSYEAPFYRGILWYQKIIFDIQFFFYQRMVFWYHWFEFFNQILKVIEYLIKKISFSESKKYTRFSNIKNISTCIIFYIRNSHLYLLIWKIRYFLISKKNAEFLISKNWFSNIKNSQILDINSLFLRYQELDFFDITNLNSWYQTMIFFI